MITTAVSIFKSFEETFDTDTFSKRYGELLELLHGLLSSGLLICPFCREEGGTGHFIFWGWYSRRIETGGDGTGRVQIRRIRCSCCRHTHAILPEETVPYSAFPTELQTRLIQAYLDKDEEARDALLEKYIDKNSDACHHIEQRYEKKWQELLRKAGASINDPLSVITEKCVTVLERQFMQTGPARIFLLERLKGSCPGPPRPTQPLCTPAPGPAIMASSPQKRRK